MTFADKVIAFNKNLSYTGAPLPDGITVMNPFSDSETMKIVEQFYKKYYNDNTRRCLILGINPGRFGAGLTGIPFTDTKRLVGECGIAYTGRNSHEPSSVFVYEVIKAFGGVDAFYDKFFINSPCPLGFVKPDENGKETNYNYYDSPKLQAAVKDYMIENILKLVSLGVETEICFCFGAGKNFAFLNKLNREFNFFGEIIALEHPRFIMQYKNKSRDVYVAKYLEAVKKAF